MLWKTTNSSSAFKSGILTASLAGVLFLAPLTLSVARGQQNAKDAEIERLRKENEILKASANVLQAQLLEAEQQRKKSAAMALALEFQLKALQTRNEQLLDQLREATRKALAGVATIVQPNDQKPNPPPNRISGVIEKVDAKDGSLVTISVGADAGLAKGHTLEVYRLKPQAKYLGLIRILDVTPQEAVGRLMRSGPANAPTLQPGDQVTSDLRGIEEPKKK